MTTRTPVVIVTGYLGSGKTTLLKRLVERSGLRLAIVMNEFGELAVDSQVLRGRNILMAELSGGCVCCSLVGEFEAAINEIIKAAQPEEIVIETTGVAEPDALVGDLRENLPMVLLDAVVTVVDGDAMLRFPALGHTGRVQIESADLLLLNKMDLVPAAMRERLRLTVRDLNPAAIVYETVRCQVDPGLIFGRALEQKAGMVSSSETHAHRMESFEMHLDHPIPRTAIECVIANLPSSIYRVKGFVRLIDGLCLVNYVAGRAEFEAWPDEGVETGLVFVGDEAWSQRSKIEEAFKRCCALT